MDAINLLPNNEILQAEILFLRQQVELLRDEIARLKEENARLKKDSSNSSKPPSTDLLKPPPPRRSGGKRHRGGQPGHRRHLRQPFPPEKVDHTIRHELSPEQAARLVPLDEWVIVQQAELVKKLYEVTEHRARKYMDPATGRIIVAPLPVEVRRGGLLGPRMTALIAFLKGGGHASYTTIERFFREVLVLMVSRGMLGKAVRKASRALAEPYEQLVQALPQAEVLGVDETGHHNAGKLHWTWCFQTPQFSLFHIDRSRGSRVLRKLLGRHFAGVLECDYYGAYRKYVRLTGGQAQFCLAHLYRDVRFLIGHPLAVLTRWGRRLLNLLRRVFKVWHQRAPDDPAGAVAGLRRIRDKFLAWVRQPPVHTLAKKLARRFEGQRAEHYFRFVEDPSLEPTNNATERALRWAVIDRKVMQATGSQAGMRWCERAWTTIQTCLKQGHNVMEYFHRAIEAHWRGQLAPALVKL